MHGERAISMLRELNSSTWLPPFDEAGVRHASREIKDLTGSIMETIESELDFKDPEVQCGLMLHHKSIHRNKRVVLAYLFHRMRRVQSLRWETGGIPSPEYTENLSRLERDFLAKYNSLLAKYNARLKLDITTDMQPPKDLFIEVRVVKDCGNILTEDGPVNLAPGTAHFLRRSDVEHLIRQGNLEHRTS